MHMDKIGKKTRRSSAQSVNEVWKSYERGAGTAGKKLPSILVSIVAFQIQPDSFTLNSGTVYV